MWRRGRTLIAGAYRRVVGDRRGVAAVEFAIILPLMLLMYIGAVDVTRGVMASRKVALLSRTVSDLVSQQPTTQDTPSSQISTIFAAASSVMAPYDTSSLKLTVSAIDIKAKSDKTCCQAVVRWSYTQGGTLRPCNKAMDSAPAGTSSPTTLPDNIVTANNGNFNYAGGGATYLIVADISYKYNLLFPYKSFTDSWFSGLLSRTTYMVPRSSTGPVTLASPVNAASGQSGAICF